MKHQSFVQAIVNWARAQYPSRHLGFYHDEMHPYRVWQGCQRIVRRLRQFYPQMQIETEVLHCAAYLHDILMNLPGWLTMGIEGAQVNFSVKEEQIGRVAYELCRRFGAPAEFAHMVQVAIEGTSPQGKLESLEANILAAADLASVAQGWETYEADFIRLVKEASTLSGKEIEPAKFAAGSMRLLGLYLQRVIRLTPAFFDPSGRSSWHLGLITNLSRLAETYLGQPSTVVDLCGEEVPLGVLSPQPEFAGSIYVTCGQEKEQRRTTWQTLPNIYQQLELPSPFCLALPDQQKALSLPDHSATQVAISLESWVQDLLPGGLTPEEVARVIKPTDGQIIYYCHDEHLLHPAVLQAMRLTPPNLHRLGDKKRVGQDRWQILYATA